MPENNSHIKIPVSLDGLEQVTEHLLGGEERLLEDIKTLLLHARIRHEYRIELKRREWGSANRIKEELAIKYFNNPERIVYINEILYRKY